MSILSRVAEGPGPTTPQQPAGSRESHGSLQVQVLTPARQTPRPNAGAVWPGKIRSRVGHAPRRSLISPHPPDSRRRSPWTTPALGTRDPLLTSDRECLRGRVPTSSTGLKCRLCGKLYPKAARSTSAPTTSARSKSTTTTRPSAASISRGEDRDAAAEHVALSRAAAARRRADRRPARRRHAADPGRPPGRGARRRRAVDQERRGQLPDALVQGPRRRRGAVARRVEFGFQTVGCASTGNLAEQRRRQRRRRRAGDATSSIPADLEQGEGPRHQRSTAPRSSRVNGTYDQVNRLCSQIAFKYGWGFVNVNLRPFYAEGSKTMGFEIAEDLGWRLPQHVVVPDGRRQPDRQDPQGVHASSSSSA